MVQVSGSTISVIRRVNQNPALMRIIFKSFDALNMKSEIFQYFTTRNH